MKVKKKKVRIETYDILPTRVRWLKWRWEPGSY
jgi:hypothetical protein